MHDGVFEPDYTAAMAIRLPKLKNSRGLALFVLGALAFLYELFTDSDRPNILYASLALMGVAAYMRGIFGGKPNDKA